MTTTAENQHFVGGVLELRQGPTFRVLSGTFPYNKTATVMNRGRVRKERFGENAFGWQIQEFARVNEAIQSVANEARRELLEEELSRRNVHILVGHDFNRPLGDMKSGSARVTSDAEAFRFEVDLPDENDMPTYMLDAIKMVRTGRAGGLSPGFRIPPRSVNPNAERIIPEPDNPAVGIRQIDDAILPEMSVVTRPAYAQTDMDLRADGGDLFIPDTRPKAATLWL